MKKLKKLLEERDKRFNILERRQAESKKNQPMVHKN